MKLLTFVLDSHSKELRYQGKAAPGNIEVKFVKGKLLIKSGIFQKKGLRR